MDLPFVLWKSFDKLSRPSAGTVPPFESFSAFTDDRARITERKLMIREAPDAPTFTFMVHRKLPLTPAIGPPFGASPSRWWKDSASSDRGGTSTTLRLSH